MKNYKWKKYARNTVFLIGIVLIVVLIANTILVETTGKSLWGLVYQVSEEHKPDIKNIDENKITILKEDGRSVCIDEYTITLEKYYYEKNIMTGHCLFSIVRDGTDMRDLYVGPEMASNKFFGGEDGRFCFEFVFEGKGTLNAYEIKGMEINATKDILYIYYDFFVDSVDFNNTVVIYDKKKHKDCELTMENAAGTFLLENTVNWKSYSDGTRQINVCPYGLTVDDSQDIEPKNLTIYFKNGKRYDIIKEGKSEAYVQKASYSKRDYIVQFRFTKYINPDEISYITWDDKQLNKRTTKNED